MLGVGWRLGGLSEIVRASSVQGAPRFDATDTWVLDGQELVVCAAGIVSPSCATGGTHATRVESYRRIAYSNTADNWTVTARDGTQYVYLAVAAWITPTPTDPVSTYYRYLLWTATDTHGNQVVYSYSCPTSPVCVPSRIDYNGTTILFYTSPRIDTTGSAEEEGTV